MSNTKLSVVIPAYNEEKNLSSGSIGEVADYLSKQDFTYEVLIVDDGSTDQTASVVEKQIRNKKGFRLIKNKHGGKALTVISGMLQTRGEVAVFTDMDQATPLNQIEKFLPKFEEGFDIVIGRREGRKGAPLARKVIAWGFAMSRTLLLGLPFADTQCGFKAFNQKAIQAVFPTLETVWQKARSEGATVNAGFDVEMLFMAKKLSLKIADVPVEWHYVGTERVHPFQDAMEAIQDMFRIRLKNIQGGYGQISQNTLD
ncbi:glycosyltransferase [Patescibacteria group bacterium]|nr:glycosyltransferase [Patescibacteria group bacterium]